MLSAQRDRIGRSRQFWVEQISKFIYWIADERFRGLGYDSKLSWLTVNHILKSRRLAAGMGNQLALCQARSWEQLSAAPFYLADTFWWSANTTRMRL